MAIKPLTLINGTTADANDVEAIFAPLYSDIAPINVQVANKLGTGRFVLESALNDATIPVGFTLGFSDYGGLVSFDTNFWRYLDGSVLNAPGSPIDGVTLQDGSGRCIVGFGTDGGGDIGVAAWNAAQIGNVGNIVSLSHTHTVNSHTHTITHTHEGGSHTLTISEMPAHDHDVRFYTADGAVNQQVTGESGGNSGDFLASGAAQSTGGGNSHSHGTTSAASTPNSGAQSPGTNSGLGNTNIQPTSIRTRWVIRIN